MITEQVTKIAPMLGLMCTLIPLGPGIVAMGNGNVNQLSTSLLIAFDGTVVGLVAAVVAMLVSAVRKRWYAQYITSLEALMTTVLDKATAARSEGIELPHNYWPSIPVGATCGRQGDGQDASPTDVASPPTLGRPQVAPTEGNTTFGHSGDGQNASATKVAPSIAKGEA
jgi:hypothetical protein